VEPGGTIVTPGVELVAGPLLGDGALDDVLLVEDELASVFRFESVGADRPQSVLPLEAVFGESWQ